MSSILLRRHDGTRHTRAEDARIRADMRVLAPLTTNQKFICKGTA